MNRRRIRNVSGTETPALVSPPWRPAGRGRHAGRGGTPCRLPAPRPTPASSRRAGPRATGAAAGPEPPRELAPEGQRGITCRPRCVFRLVERTQGLRQLPRPSHVTYATLEPGASTARQWTAGRRQRPVRRGASCAWSAALPGMPRARCVIRVALTVAGSGDNSPVWTGFSARSSGHRACRSRSRQVVVDHCWDLHSPAWTIDHPYGSAVLTRLFPQVTPPVLSRLKLVSG